MWQMLFSIVIYLFYSNLWTSGNIYVLSNLLSVRPVCDGTSHDHGGAAVFSPADYVLNTRNLFLKPMRGSSQFHLNNFLKFLLFIQKLWATHVEIKAHLKLNANIIQFSMWWEIQSSTILLDFDRLRNWIIDNLLHFPTRYFQYYHLKTDKKNQIKSAIKSAIKIDIQIKNL